MMAWVEYASSTIDIWGQTFDRMLGDIGLWILDIPNKIKEGLKEIFVPDTEYIESSFESFRNELKMKFSFDTEFFDTLFDDERPVTDIFTEYNIAGVGSFNLKVFDTKFFYDGVTYFRPFIRGFIVLLLAFYNVRMVLSFVRQDAGVVAGKGADIDAGKKGGRYE